MDYSVSISNFHDIIKDMGRTDSINLIPQSFSTLITIFYGKFLRSSGGNTKLNHPGSFEKEDKIIKIKLGLFLSYLGFNHGTKEKAFLYDL